jgi:ribosomal protein L12E/L44/L45/RPP1/RPP2
LKVVAGLDVSTKQVERLTQQIGAERVRQRDAQVAAFEARPLRERVESPTGRAPAVAVVERDGGRPQTAARGAAATAVAAEATAPEWEDDEDEDEERHRRGRHWREDKVGLLMTVTSTAAASDPCPEVPEVFLRPAGILKLARELKPSILVPEGPAPGSGPAPESSPPWRGPKPLVRTVVATRACGQVFGRMLAWAAWARGFAKADRKAFVADGARVNWTIHRRWFADYTAILDFIHALSYVFAAAMAGGTSGEGWSRYRLWIDGTWGGRVKEVIAAMRARAEELKASGGDPKWWEAVTRSLSYLEANQDRMRYDLYRTWGLPVSSSHMESLIKQINRRVKGTEKFWSEAGAETILQLRADILSETEPLEEFWRERQENETGRRRYRRSA